MNQVDVTAVVALTRDGGLGNEGRLPWHPRRLQIDMAFLKHSTTHQLKMSDSGIEVCRLSRIETKLE